MWNIFRSKQSRSVMDGGNPDIFTVNEVNDAVVLRKHLSNIFATKFRNDAP